MLPRRHRLSGERGDLRGLFQLSLSRHAGGPLPPGARAAPAELQSVGQSCGECQCHCDCTDDCCCAESVLAALSSLSLNKRATLTAGPLLLQNVSVLGTIGNVLVLGNDQAYRFYFVCANQVEFLA